MGYILRFAPIYKERIWGGRNLARVLGKELPEGIKIGESWELADLPEDKSTVINGPEKGKTISAIINEWREDLLGNIELDAGQFPLLIKFLDANDILSVQVHPDYETAEKMGGNVRPKYEGWFIIDAKPDSFIYRGFKPGVSLSDVSKSINNGNLEDLLLKIPAKRGDFFYLPGGTVHALGPGLLVAEVQTPSDTTFRLYDWNRIDPKTGKGRELHIDQGLQSIKFYSWKAYQSAIGDTSGLLADAPTFEVYKKYVPKGYTEYVNHIDPIVWIIIEGDGIIKDRVVEEQLTRGAVVLIPPSADDVQAKFYSNTVYLSINLK